MGTNCVCWWIKTHTGKCQFKFVSSVSCLLRVNTTLVDPLRLKKLFKNSLGTASHKTNWFLLLFFIDVMHLLVSDSIISTWAHDNNNQKPGHPFFFPSSIKPQKTDYSLMVQQGIDWGRDGRKASLGSDHPVLLDLYVRFTWDYVSRLPPPVSVTHPHE